MEAKHPLPLLTSCILNNCLLENQSNACKRDNSCMLSNGNSVDCLEFIVPRNSVEETKVNFLETRDGRYVDFLGFVALYLKYMCVFRLL